MIKYKSFFKHLNVLFVFSFGLMQQAVSEPISVQIFEKDEKQVELIGVMHKGDDPAYFKGIKNIIDQHKKSEAKTVDFLLEAALYDSDSPTIQQMQFFELQLARSYVQKEQVGPFLFKQADIRQDKIWKWRSIDKPAQKAWLLNNIVQELDKVGMSQSDLEGSYGPINMAYRDVIKEKLSLRLADVGFLSYILKSQRGANDAKTILVSGNNHAIKLGKMLEQLGYQKVYQHGCDYIPSPWEKPKKIECIKPDKLERLISRFVYSSLM